MAAQFYTYSIASDTANGVLNEDRLRDEIEKDATMPSLAYNVSPISRVGDMLRVAFKFEITDDEETTLTSIVNAHTGEDFNTPPSIEISNFAKNKESYLIVDQRKSFSEVSKSFTTTDLHEPRTWWYDSTETVSQVLTDSGDGLTFTSGVQNWVDKKLITDRNKLGGQCDITIEVNSTEMALGTDYTLDTAAGSVTFTSSQSGNTVTATYSVGNSPTWELIPPSGKVWKIPYVEMQFSSLCTFPEGFGLVFEAVYNGPAVPALGIPLNYDVPVETRVYYNAKDLMNGTTKGQSMEPFGEFTKPINVLPFDYVSGYTLKEPGEPTTNLMENEFNKFKIYLLDPTKTVEDTEISTGTFYLLEEDL